MEALCVVYMVDVWLFIVGSGGWAWWKEVNNNKSELNKNISYTVFNKLWQVLWEQWK